jgi:hypothetical protein
MILSKKLEKFNKSLKIIYYEKDKKGRINPKKETPEFAGKENLANILYYTKAFELKRLKEEVIKGIISPIQVFVTLQNMDIKDLASRLRISFSKARKHLTLEGFKKINIETLEKYARIFDVSVADFFYFLNVDDSSKLDIKHYHNKLIQDINLKK